MGMPPQGHFAPPGASDMPPQGAGSNNSGDISNANEEADNMGPLRAGQQGGFNQGMGSMGFMGFAGPQGPVRDEGTE